MSTNRPVCQIMFVAIFGASSVAAPQNLREAARAQAIRNPGVSLEQPAPPSDYEPKAIEELAKESVVVLQARLWKASSYLSQREDRILTDYQIAQPKVIAGRLGVASPSLPGPVQPLILTEWGGEVLIEGVPVRGTDHSREPIRDGGEYLLFLRESRPPKPGHYEIFYGAIFEVVQDEVKPLLKEADRVFKGPLEARLKELVLRIQSSVQAR
ncbi:MAG: hypothetical protein ABIS06_07830 [Vicinamibacterales bacterium]